MTPSIPAQSQSTESQNCGNAHAVAFSCLLHRTWGQQAQENRSGADRDMGMCPDADCLGIGVCKGITLYVPPQHSFVSIQGSNAGSDCLSHVRVPPAPCACAPCAQLRLRQEGREGQGGAGVGSVHTPSHPVPRNEPMRLHETSVA